MSVPNFSEADLDALRRVIAAERRRSRTAEGRPDVPSVVRYAPEVYMARCGAEGIPALDPATAGTGTGTGTGTDTGHGLLDDAPGSAECDIYRLVNSTFGEVLQPVGFRHTVYNYSLTAVEPYSLVRAVRDKWGTWWCDPQGDASSLRVKELDGTPNVSPVNEVRVGNGTLTDLGGGVVELANALRVKEIDGTPNVSPVSEMQFTNGTVTDLGGGAVQITIAAGSITVVESDGSPSGIATTLQINQATGLTVTSVSGGTAVLANAAATGTTWGVVSSTTQSFGGVKTFNDDVNIQDILTVNSASQAVNNSYIKLNSPGTSFTTLSYVNPLGGSVECSLTVENSSERGILGISSIYDAGNTRTVVLTIGAKRTDSVYRPAHYATIDGFGNTQVGLYATAAGLTFSGGLFTGGTFTQPDIDGGTW